ncbi:YoaK family protein [Massilia sp. S19_KUP03_FR1]|uniref:YoaK family protein n=1 Tax=Massilia sp. S19_KUP03_FR1 TaxID=3025503 RepID=UPI002FCCD0DB
MAANRSRTQGIALSFLAGYVDTLGFIALFGLFTAHVTGNFILIGAAMADPGHTSLLFKFLAFPAFILGVAVMPVLVAWTRRRAVRALPLAYGLQLLLLASFMLFGMAAMPLGDAPSHLAMAAGLCGAAAMGVHSGTSRLLLSELAPTSMMTGNVTQVVIDTVDYLRGERGPGIGARCAKFVWPVLAFGVGAIIAAFAWHAIGFIALAAPLLILAVLIWKELAAPAVVSPG